MDAPTTAQEIKAAYKALYTATANAMQAARKDWLAAEALKDAEQSRVWTGSNEGERKANMRDNTVDVRLGAQIAHAALLAAEREQALAKIAVNEIRELLRLAEWDNTSYYRED